MDRSDWLIVAGFSVMLICASVISAISAVNVTKKEMALSCVYDGRIVVDGKVYACRWLEGVKVK